MVTLTINEDTKLGEKLYQIRTRALVPSTNDHFTFIYFTLLEQGNLNQTFYLSNQDGSLYLIKKLDADNSVNSNFNLTVLVTNWLGQTENVFIEINVNDINDNRPVFEMSTFNLKDTVDLTMNGSDIRVYDLMNAYDADNLDRGKLTFKIEDCFYVASNLLIQKQDSYPLCSKHFISLTWSTEKNYNSKFTKPQMKVNINEMVKFLKGSSDLLLDVNNSSSIQFHMDMSLKDSSLHSSSMSRVNFALNFKNNQIERNQISKPKIVQKLNQINKKEEKQIKFGFRRSVYYIQISSLLNSLEDNIELARLNEEFIWYDQLENSFAPFQLKFQIIENTKNSSFKIEPYFGSLYLNNTDIDPINEITVGCQVAESISDQFEGIKTTKIVLSMTTWSITPPIYKQQLNNFLQRPIWKLNNMTAFISENQAIGSRINKDKHSNDPFTVKDYIDIDDVNFFKSNSLSNRDIRLSYTIISQPDFEIDITTGYIRSLVVFDYERTTKYSLEVRVCLSNAFELYPVMSTMKTVCFLQTAIVQVEIQNRNDNSPILMGGVYEINLIELQPAMSLFKLITNDADDNDNNEETFEYSIDNVTTNLLSQNMNCFNVTTTKMFNKDSFQLFSKNNVQLTMKGFKVISSLAELKCPIKIKIKCSVIDNDIYSNSTIISLNLITFDGLNNRHLIPTIQKLKIKRTVESNVLIFNVAQHLTRKSGNHFNFKLNLLNYEDIFSIVNDKNLILNPTVSVLNEDDYELLIRIENNQVETFNNYFKIVIEVQDSNANRPQFFEPKSVEKTRIIMDNYDLFFYNTTTQWSLFIYTNESSPFIKVILNFNILFTIHFSIYINLNFYLKLDFCQRFGQRFEQSN
jgi:hypothetical protein